MITQFNRQPAWNKLGHNVIGLSIPEAMQNAQIDFTVGIQPLQVQLTDEKTNLPTIVDVAGKQVTYRTDTNRVLGLVGDRYHVYQTKQAVAVCEDLAAGGWQPEWAGSLRGGAVVFIVGRLPFKTQTNEVEPYLAVLNSFDGSTGLSFANTPLRARCTNAIRRTFKVARSTATFRHTAQLEVRTESVRERLALTEAYYRHLDFEIQQLMATPLEDTRQKALDLIVPLPDPKDERRYENAWNKQIELSTHWATSETIDNTWRNTAWGLVNAVSELEQWGAKKSGTVAHAERLFETHLSMNTTQFQTDKIYRNLRTLMPA